MRKIFLRFNSRIGQLAVSVLFLILVGVISVRTWGGEQSSANEVLSSVHSNRGRLRKFD